MALIQRNPIPDPLVSCPIFHRQIAEGLCWDISNIGNDSLNLPPECIPPCGWDAAHRICDECPKYISMGE